MRIAGIEAIPIDIPLARNLGGSTYAVLKRSTVITRMRTDEGLPPPPRRVGGYFTVTLLARLRGLSGSWPRWRARS